MHHLRWSLCVILLLCGGLEPVLAEVTQKIRSSGLAAVYDGDIDGAFEQARKAALRQAVEEGIGVLITAQTRVSDFAVIEDDILSHTEGYVRQYALVEHGLVDSSTYRVTLDAQVSLGKLHDKLDALELLIESIGNPGIICLGRERMRIDETWVDLSLNIVGTGLNRMLASASDRFNLIEPTQVIGSDPFSDSVEESGLTEKAEILVRGDAVVQKAEGIAIPGSGRTLQQAGIHSVRAQLRVEALWTDTGDLFATLSSQARAASTTEEAAYDNAIRKCVEKIREDLLRQLAEDWREKVYSGRLIRLEVRAERTELDLFEREFSSRISGMEKLYPRSYDDGRGIYEARSKRSGFQVARQLAAEGFGELDVEIDKVSANALGLHLSAK